MQQLGNVQSVFKQNSKEHSEDYSNSIRKNIRKSIQGTIQKSIQTYIRDFIFEHRSRMRSASQVPNRQKTEQNSEFLKRYENKNVCCYLLSFSCTTMFIFFHVGGFNSVTGGKMSMDVINKRNITLRD